MKTNIKLMAVSACAALALAGCGKNSEPQTPAPVTNAVPNAAKPDAPAPSTTGGADINAGVVAPAIPQNTNSSAVTNQ